MATFQVTATITAEAFYEVEANSQAEAEAIVGAGTHEPHMTTVIDVLDVEATEVD